MSELFNFAKSAPSWMDQSFFNKVVREVERDPQAVVEEFEVTAGSNPGDNFASSLFRGKLAYKSKFTGGETKSISVIIKTEIITDLANMDLLKDTPFFRNEMDMYGKVLPEIQSLWLSVGDKELLCPKLIYQTTDPVPTIILEDLSPDGFGVMPQPQDDFEVSKRIARRLGKFHAATFFLHHEQKFDFADYNMSLFQNPQLVDMIYEKSLEAFIDVAQNWEGYEKYIPHLQNFKTKYLNRSLRSYTPNRPEMGFNVLNHGDFHHKNLLFKQNSDGSVNDFYFIDYQIGIYASPAIDLIYALYYAMSAENRQLHRDEFILTYYRQFVASLKAFGYLKAPPSLIDLKVEMLKNGNIEVLIAICTSIFFYIDLSTLTAEDMDMGEGTDRAKRRMYEAPGFKEVILKELPRFLGYGFL